MSYIDGYVDLYGRHGQNLSVSVRFWPKAAARLTRISSL